MRALLVDMQTLMPLHKVTCSLMHFPIVMLGLAPDVRSDSELLSYSKF